MLLFTVLHSAGNLCLKVCTEQIPEDALFAGLSEKWGFWKE